MGPIQMRGGEVLNKGGISNRLDTRGLGCYNVEKIQFLEWDTAMITKNAEKCPSDPVLCLLECLVAVAILERQSPDEINAYA